MPNSLHSLRAILLALAVFLLGCSGEDSDAANVPLVQTAWTEFREASLSGKGELAANRVSSATHAYYTDLRDQALHSTREELEAMALGQRYMALSMRLRIPTEQLEAMSGKQLFAHAIDQGWIGKDSASKSDIGTIEVHGDFAKARVLAEGKPTELSFEFLKEDGTWRFDMKRIMMLTNVAFDAMLKDSGMQEDEFTSWMLQATTGKVLKESSWDPPRPLSH